MDWMVWLAYFFATILVALFFFFLLHFSFLFATILYLNIYKWRTSPRSFDDWDEARRTLASIWVRIGWIWHGHELVGFENIPDDGPALIIFYHAPAPVDMFYLQARSILEKGRTLHCVAERLNANMPGFGVLPEAFDLRANSVQGCVDLLNQGEIVCVAPGGMREQLFSDSRTYNLIWNQRLGFAKVALEARVPIIPMFTENCHEAFRAARWSQRLFRKLYEEKKIPVFVCYGGYPVKMRTYLGPPVQYDPEGLTPEELRDKVKDAVEELIRNHQRLPGNMIRALLQRFPWYDKKLS